jgi:autotransporter-associated beta strand protein
MKIRKALLVIAFFVIGLTAQAATYTWSNAAGGGLWGVSGNWVGSPTLTFDNTTVIQFDSSVSGTITGSANSINGNRTIKSMVFGSDVALSSGISLNVRCYNSFSATKRNLTFSADSGNASITVAQQSVTPPTGQYQQVRLGTSTGGNVILNSDLDLAQHNTFFNSFFRTPGFQFDGPVSGVGAINKSGAGEVRFVRGNANWSGGLSINEGNVSVFANANALGSGSVTLNGDANNTSLSLGSTLTYTNNIVVADGAGTRTIKNYTGTTGNPTLQGGTIDLSAGKDITFDIDDFAAGTESMSMADAISGSGGVVKVGDGFITFWATNNYTGDTAIEAGTLTLNGNGLAGTGDITISSGATLAFGSLIGRTVANDISGAGQMVQDGANTYLTGDATHTGGTTINGGNLRIGNGGTSGSVSGDILVNNGVLVFQRSDAITYSGVISGAGNVVIPAVSGTNTFTGMNTYTGLTTVSGGMLIIGSDALLGTSEVIVSDGAALTLQSDICINDSAILNISTNATLVLDFAGSEEVGLLSLDGGNTFFSSGTYDAARLNSLGSGTYSGTGAIRVGPLVGTLILLQ